jgi:hypothetical protein|tara:strand:- start:352 stop:576 length:225 start_codon:yes stop_codon:yes gene_type:complete
MGWLHKEEIDVSQWQADTLEKQLRNKIVEHMWNLPIVIKTGTTPGNRMVIHRLLDELHVGETICKRDTIEIVSI